MVAKGMTITYNKIITAERRGLDLVKSWEVCPDLAEVKPETILEHPLSINRDFLQHSHTVCHGDI